MSTLTQVRAPASCRKLEVFEADVQSIGRDDAARMLFLLHLIREFELKLLDYSGNDLVHGPVHSSIGQEAVAAAVAVVLNKGDMVASTHRAHGHFLSKAIMYYAPDDYQPLDLAITAEMQDSVNRTLAEIMGLREGWCGGRGGSMHLYDGTSGNLGSNAIVGGGIPIATGAAWAQKLQDRDNVVVSFFGDGAINQGCFHEVANMAALWDAPVLYLVENNLYAVGTSTAQSSYVQDLALRSLGYGINSLIIDGMDPVAMYVGVRDVVENMRREPFPFLIEAKTYRYYHHGGGSAGSTFGYRERGEETTWQDRDPIEAYPQRLLRSGLLEEDDNARLQAMAQESVELAADFCTEEKDGQRFIPASKWPDPATVGDHIRCNSQGLPGAQYVERADFTDLKPLSYQGAVSGAILRSMERDERVIVLGEELENLGGGAYGSSRGIKEVYPERLFNTPISETGFVGMGGGLAAVGMRPVVEIMFPDFALMSSDQLFNQIGKLRHMYGGQVCFPLILRTRVAITYGYGGQHSMDPAAVFALFSGWRIVAPSTAFDYIGLFNTAMAYDDPVLIVEHGRLYADEDQVPANDPDYFVEYGKANIVREGSDVTVLAYLTSVKKCVQMADELAADGISAEVIDLRTLDLQGMDFETIGRSLKKTGSVLCVDQTPRSLSLSGRIADEIQLRFFDYLDCPVGKLTAVDVPPPVSKVLEEAALPSMAQIKAAIGKGGKHMF